MNSFLLTILLYLRAYMLDCKLLSEYNRILFVRLEIHIVWVNLGF